MSSAFNCSQAAESTGGKNTDKRIHTDTSRMYCYKAEMA